MIRGAIFDVDGTLLDSMSVWENAAERFLAQRGITAEPDLGRILYPMTLTGAAQYLIRTCHLKESEEEVVKGVISVVERFYAEEVMTKPGVPAFLQSLEKEGIPMTVATSSRRGYLEKAFNRLGIARFFSGIYTCDEYRTSKNEPEIYLHAAEPFAAEPAEILVFEDAVHAVKTAYKAGFRVIGVSDPTSAVYEEEIRRCSAFFLEDFRNTREFQAQILQKRDF